MIQTNSPEKRTAPYPHCDSRTLHAPGSCQYCDHYPDFQQARLADGVNFTGETIPGLKPCPSDAARGVGGSHVWPGNRPRPVSGETQAGVQDVRHAQGDRDRLEAAGVTHFQNFEAAGDAPENMGRGTDLIRGGLGRLQAARALMAGEHLGERGIVENMPAQIIDSTLVTKTPGRDELGRAVQAVTLADDESVGIVGHLRELASRIENGEVESYDAVTQVVGGAPSPHRVFPHRVFLITYTLTGS